jgi:hypothetical protein
MWLLLTNWLQLRVHWSQWLRLREGDEAVGKSNNGQCIKKGWDLAIGKDPSDTERYFDLPTASFLNLGCLHPVARVISYDVGFNPSTQRHYRTLIYHLYIHSYMFRSHDHHQAEKYITTLGLLIWQRIRCFIWSHIPVIVYTIMLRNVDMPLLRATFFLRCVPSVYRYGRRRACQCSWACSLSVDSPSWLFFWLRCCVYSAPVVCIWFWQCSVVLCPGFWWGCAFLCVCVLPLPPN